MPCSTVDISPFTPVLSLSTVGAYRFERTSGLVLRFIIGHSGDQVQEQALAAEAAEHGGFLRLPLEVWMIWLDGQVA